VMAEARNDVTSDRSEAVATTGPGAPDPTTGEWPVVASMAREGFLANAWRGNAAVSYYIGPPRDRSCGRPCPRCLEPGIVVQSAHARWCKPDSEVARARRQAAREERRARRVAVQTGAGEIKAEQGQQRAPARRRGLREEGLLASDRRLLDSIRLYEILARYGPVGTVPRAIAG